MQTWKLAWDGGRCSVQSLGGAVHDLALETGSGTGAFRPLAEAPWRGKLPQTRDYDCPGHLAHLGGEWPCVPFGTTADSPEHHGFGANAHWRAVRRTGSAIDLEIRYPTDHPVAGLRRSVRGCPGEAALELSLTIEPRRRVRLPIGLHPIFTLSPGMRIAPSGFGQGVVFPRPFEPGISRLKPGAHFSSGARVALADGGTQDVLDAPFSLQEELVQLFDCQGPINLIYPDAGLSVALDWDHALLPHCLLWISNHGRSGPPWNQRFRGLGVEPVNAIFDDAALWDGQGRHPGVLLEPGKPLSTSYWITLHDTPVANDQK